MRNMKVGVKLLIMTVPLMILLVVVTIASGMRQLHVLREAKEVYFKELAEIEATLITADRDLYQAQLAMQQSEIAKYTGEDNAGFISDYEENLQQSYDAVAKAKAGFGKDDYLFTEYKAEGIDKTNKQLLEAFDADVHAWAAVYNPKTGEGVYDDQLAAFKTARENLNGMEDSLEAYESYIDNKLEGRVKKGVTSMVIVIVIFAVLCAVVMVYVVKYILGSIYEIQKDLRTMADKDLSTAPHINSSSDEFGDLSRSGEELFGSLNEIISNISESANSVAESGKDISELAKVTDSQVGTITDAINDMAQTATQQAHDVSDISMNMDELNGMIDNSRTASEELERASSEIDSVTGAGVEEIEKLTGITQESMQAFTEIFGLIEGITDRANKISMASQLISDIAEQTNLLSLNASIEAARAGEAGRGFAVVAEEIGKLANQSQESAGTINRMLDELHTAIESANRQSDAVKNYVDLQRESVDATKSRFEDIVCAIEKVNVEIESINSINAQMAESFDQVNGLVTNLSASAEENAASSEEIAAIATEVKMSVNDVSVKSDEIRETADNLVSVVNEFELV